MLTQANVVPLLGPPAVRRTWQVTHESREAVDSGGMAAGTLCQHGCRRAGAGGGALGVNSFLWRATLDTIAFMPVSTADPFGGVILTDWHSTEEAPNERFKLNVYILGRTLRADGIRVAVFGQTKDSVGQWRDSTVPDATGTKIEDAILTRARQLRRQTITNK